MEAVARFGREFTDTDWEYNRQRFDPRPGDEFYLCLVDLQRALRPRLEQARGRWLGFGAGRSPYGRWITEADLRYADFPSDAGVDTGLDYKLEPGRPCPAPDAWFDGIVSTQVLEHVDDPPAYLADACRMLKPGGQLLQTIRGIRADHQCPHELHRWTQQSLRDDISAAGFEVLECLPLTCGARGLLQQLTVEMSKASVA